MSTMAQSKQYCAGCVTTAKPAGRCAQCQWDDAELPEMHAHLPRHYLLMDRYYIGRVLGQGGFGVTYLARDMRLERPVAVKEYLPAEQCSRLTDRVTIRSHTGEKAEQFQHGLEGFLKEAHALAQFEGHANIVSVTDSAEANGTAYLVMSYIEGVSLKQYLAEQGGRLAWRTAVETMMPVMDALRETHSQGLLHRDISPGNIMITRRGQVKVIDFGAARYAIGEHSKSLSMVLKPGYAPEEQYRTRGKQGPWTDVYAAATTLYQCITGQVPPSAPDRLAEDELAWPSSFCGDLPHAVEAVVLKGMAVRAADRYQSIEEFQQALLQAVGTEPVKRVVPEVKPEVVGPAAQSSRKTAIGPYFLFLGIVAYAVSFFLIVIPGQPVFRGWQCAILAFYYPWDWIKHGAADPAKNAVFELGMLFSALINPVFILHLLLRTKASLREAATVFSWILLVLNIAPWLVFKTSPPREGYFVWVAGMLVAMFSARIARWVGGNHS